MSVQSQEKVFPEKKVPQSDSSQILIKHRSKGEEDLVAQRQQTWQNWP